MRLEPSKWNPFRFLRRSADKRGDGDGQRAAALPDVPLDPFGAPDRWFGDFSPALFQPRIDVVDAGDALQISADLPGMQRDDIEILYEDGFLVLRGEKQAESRKEEKGCYRLERAFGSFQRIIPLPEDVDVERADAHFEKGVLTLRLPKRQGTTSDLRRIQVK